MDMIFKILLAVLGVLAEMVVPLLKRITKGKTEEIWNIVKLGIAYAKPKYEEGMEWQDVLRVAVDFVIEELEGRGQTLADYDLEKNDIVGMVASLLRFGRDMIEKD